MKRISLFNLPYQITLISIFLPLIASFFWVELHRIILVITVFLFIVLFIQGKGKIIFSKPLLSFLIIILMFFIYDIIFGRGLFYFSHSHSFIYIFIFFHCYMYDECRFDENTIINQISKIYSIIIIFMIIELLFHISGNSNILFNLFSGPNYEFESVFRP